MQYDRHRVQRLVLVLAASTDQAPVVFHYAKAFLESAAVLRQEIVDATRSEIRLKNNITIAIHSNSFRTIRGRTLCGWTVLLTSYFLPVPEIRGYRLI